MGNKISAVKKMSLFFVIIALWLSAAETAPSVEVLLHLPPVFSDIDAFKAFLGVRPERHTRQKRETPDEEPKQPVDDAIDRMKRAEAAEVAEIAQVPESAVVDSDPILVQYPVALPYLSSPQFMDDGLPPDDPRKRRNTSANDHEDKRPYPDPSMNQDGTTTAPFWKHKKSPQFVTSGREGQLNFEQTRRTNDNARESHSMKDGKSISSNEIPRMADSYYASSNDRTAFSRQSTPKSVYDSIDYTNRRNIDPRARLAPDLYERNYYPSGEFANRGVEYYHRSVDPNTGRIIYFANLPEPDAYRASRSFPYYDPYPRSFPAFNNYPYPYNYNPYWNPYQVTDFSRNFRSYQPSQRYENETPRNKTYVIFDSEEKRFGANYANRPVDDRYRPYTPPLPYPSFSPLSYNAYSSPYPNNYNTYRNQDLRGIVRQVELPLTSRSSLKTTA